VPDVPAPTPVPSSTSSSSSSSSSTQTTTQTPKVHHPSGPTTEQMIQTTIMTGVMEGLFSSLFAPTPTGPDPAEVLRQQEEQRKIEEQKRQEFLRQNATVSSSLKTPGQNNSSTATHSQFFGIGIKSPPDQSILNEYAKPTGGGVDIGWGTMPVSLRQQNSISEAEWAKARECQKRIDQLRKKDKLTDAEIAALEESEATRNATWQKAVGNPNLTQEERERLKLKLYSAPAELGDHPMVDSRAFAQREQWTDPYLDVATAAAKGGATSVAVSLTEEGGKGVLKTLGGSDIGYDELLAGGKAGIDTPQTTTDKVIAVGEYAAGKIFKPKQVIIVTGTANAVGSGTRQAMVRYWAGQDEESLTPVADAKERWNTMVSNRNENVQSMLNWVGAGQFKD
jgi:hypothetical protein